MKIKELLLPIYSLPGKYGIGEFSKEAFSFIDFLKENNITKWITFSPFENNVLLNEAYVSLDDLFSRELVSKPIEFNTSKKVVVYKDVFRLKSTYYFEAYCNFVAKYGVNQIYEFGDKNPDIFKECKRKADSNIRKERAKMYLEYYLFNQMLLVQEWDYIKNHAEDCGVEIVFINEDDACKYLSVLDLLKLNKKFQVKELNENNICFKLKSFKKLMKIIKKNNND